MFCYPQQFGVALDSAVWLISVWWWFSFVFRAVNQLNTLEVEGKPLKVELAVEKRPRRGPRGPGGAPFGGLPGQSRQTDFPLRILVQSDMVSWEFKFIERKVLESELAMILRKHVCSQLICVMKMILTVRVLGAGGAINCQLSFDLRIAFFVYIIT